MPFTPSHVAAILPFARTPLVPSALVIGSMAPDLFYYVPLPISRTLTHSLPGVFTVDLVFGIVLFSLWELVFRRPLTDFTPLPARSRLATMPEASIRPHGLAWWKVAVLLVASVLLGTLTHVFWDSFTHAGATVDQLPVLKTVWHTKPLYRWAQWASSLLGFLGVVAWIVVWLRRTRPVAPAATRLSLARRSSGWITVAVAGVATSMVVWAIGIANGLSPIANRLVFHTITFGLAAAALVAVAWCLAWWRMRPVAPTALP
jgi:Domain of unknown function (DUF4184)